MPPPSVDFTRDEPLYVAISTIMGIQIFKTIVDINLNLKSTHRQFIIVLATVKNMLLLLTVSATQYAMISTNVVITSINPNQISYFAANKTTVQNTRTVGKRYNVPRI